MRKYSFPAGMGPTLIGSRVSATLGRTTRRCTRVVQSVDTKHVAAARWLGD
jgi:hypothetical protein